MKGVYIKKAEVVSDDERRTITEIMNGQLSVKNLKLLVIKKNQLILGNHYHQYPEVMCVLKGFGHYHMRNIDTGESEEYDLEEGDVVFRTGRIVHAGYFKEGSVLIDGGCEQYISADFNDISEVIMK